MGLAKDSFYYTAIAIGPCRLKHFIVHCVNWEGMFS